MRPASLLSILVLWPALVHADEKTPAKSQASDIRYAIQDRAEVRCQPSDTSQEIYLTNLLHPGDPVEVVADAGNGWLKIKPPFGSYSWINQIFTKPGAPGHYIVCSSGVKVFPGTEVANIRPGGYFSAELQDGTVLTAIAGKKKTDDDGIFLGIEPPEGEYRYIKSQYVSRTRPNSAVASNGSQFQTQTSAKNPAEVTQASAAAGGVALTTDQADDLWRRARHAELAGNYREAVRLFREVGYGRQKADPGWARKFLDYADWLEKADARSRTGTAPRAAERPAGQQSELHGPAGANRTVAVPASHLASDCGAAAPIVRLAAPQSGAGPVPGTTVSLGDGQPRWKGRLRRSGRFVDLQPTYVLENDAGSPITYVMAQSGVNLESWIGKEVELFGSVNYRGDLRALVMNATQARQP